MCSLFISCLACTLPSLHLVSVVFGTAIPTSLYIFGKCFSYFIYFATLFTALSCPLLEAPLNGSIDCETQTVGGACNYSCEATYTLRGSTSRNCLPSLEWTGQPTVCDPPMCPELTPPDNGFVLFPCTREESHTCSVVCAHGYNITGSPQQTCELNGTLNWSEPPTCEGELHKTTIFVNQFCPSIFFLQSMIHALLIHVFMVDCVRKLIRALHVIVAEQIMLVQHVTLVLFNFHLYQC